MISKLVIEPASAGHDAFFAILLKTDEWLRFLGYYRLIVPLNVRYFQPLIKSSDKVSTLGNQVFSSVESLGLFESEWALETKTEDVGNLLFIMPILRQSSFTL